MSIFPENRSEKTPGKISQGHPPAHPVRISPFIDKEHPLPKSTESIFMDGNIIDRVWRLGPTAESLGISKKTLQRLVARAEIATVAITGRIKGISESERRRFIEARTGGARGAGVIISRSIPPPSCFR